MHGATVPDLPGCFSAGDTLDDAIDNAREAIDVHCEAPADAGCDIPVPRPLAEHRACADFDGALWALVDVDVSRYQGRAEKINITVPARVLARIDDYARRHGESRSGFLTRAALAAIEASA